MAYYTPLRYPGGKRRLLSLVTQLLDANSMKDIEYAEPYAGGAAIALALLLYERAAAIHINDLSRPVYAFWYTVLNDTVDLCRRIERARVSMAEWRRQRAVYENREAADLGDLGFSTLFLNRTNRSGIISGGVIGGKEQAGQWSLGVRFNKPELIQRIRRIGRYRNRIKLYQMDALKFTVDVLPRLSNAFAFFDPPYIENGKDLYLNDYDLDGHRKLAAKILKLKIPWIVTYDRGAVQAGLYKEQRRMSYGLAYTAQGRYEGREVMFFADHLILPEAWRGCGRILMSSKESRFPVYGKMENVGREAAV